MLIKKRKIHDRKFIDSVEWFLAHPDGETSLDVVCKVIENMNVVLKQIVPGLTIGVVNLGNELFPMEKGAVNCNWYPVKQPEIPLQYESEGIKKIISILQLLIVVYNKASITVAIDRN